MQTFLQDIRFALRNLLKDSSTSLVILVTLAISMGAVTSLFTVIHAVILRPLPYKSPERLVRIFESNPKKDAPFFSVSPPNFMDWKSQSRLFEDMAAMSRPDDYNLQIQGQPEPTRVSRMSANFLSLLGIAPLKGRYFLNSEDRPNSEDVVVLSYSVWQQRFGGNDRAIGMKLLLNGKPYTIIGVMPAGFRLPFNDAELFVPLKFLEKEMDRSHHFLRVLGRLRSGITMEQSKAELSAIADRIAQQYPSTNQGWGVAYMDLKSVVVGEEFKKSMLLLFAAVALVLLIACSNVANLLSARATGRQNEIALRAALGATRFRLIRQLITESALMAVLGGILGLVIATWGTDLLLSMANDRIPRIQEIQINGAVLAFTFVLSMITAIFFGTAPAMQSSRADLNSVLKNGSKGSMVGSQRSTIRNLFVIVEVALALVVVFGAALLIRSFWKIDHVHPGFDPNQVIALRLHLPESKYPEPEMVQSFHSQMLDRISAISGVESAATTSIVPMGEGNSMTVFKRTDRLSGTSDDVQAAAFRIVSPGYFSTMKIQLQSGHIFGENEGKASPGMLVIDAAMRQKFWPGEDPVGKRVKVALEELHDFVIVGVVDSVKNSGLDEEEDPTMYMSTLQVPPQRSSTLVIRGKEDPLKLMAAIRIVIRNQDKDQAVSEIETMNDVVDRSLSPQRFNMVLFTIFAVIAAILSAVGIYAVMAHSVTSRMHEMGIRIALGAQGKDLVTMVLKQGMRLVAFGLIAGLFISLSGASVMSSLLFEISPGDPKILFDSLLLIGIIAFAACLIPAYRAAHIDAQNALRFE